LKEFKGLSALGELGLKYELHDVAKPDRPEAEILKLFKRRLLNTKLRLICMNCGGFSLRCKVSDMPSEPRCSKCSSKLLAAVSIHMNDAQPIIKKRLKGKGLTMEEEKKLMVIRRSADVMIVNGKNGAMVLAGRGVGPSTALRILRKFHKSEEDLFKDILTEERNFLKNKRFWT